MARQDGPACKTLRLAKYLSLRTVAAHAKTSLRTLLRVERGIYVEPDSYRRICEALEGLQARPASPYMKPPKKPQGFAALSQRKRQEIASMGGRATNALGSGHRFSTEEARAAGAKGGKTVSANRRHMQAIGRKGGRSRRTGR